MVWLPAWYRSLHFVQLFLHEAGVLWLNWRVSFRVKSSLGLKVASGVFMHSHGNVLAVCTWTEHHILDSLFFCQNSCECWWKLHSFYFSGFGRWYLHSVWFQTDTYICMCVYLYLFRMYFSMEVGNFLPQRSLWVREVCSHLVGYLMYPLSL